MQPQGSCKSLVAVSHAGYSSMGLTSHDLQKPLIIASPVLWLDTVFDQERVSVKEMNNSYQSNNYKKYKPLLKKGC